MGYRIIPHTQEAEARELSVVTSSRPAWSMSSGLVKDT